MNFVFSWAMPALRLVMLLTTAAMSGRSAIRVSTRGCRWCLLSAAVTMFTIQRSSAAEWRSIRTARTPCDLESVHRLLRGLGNSLPAREGYCPDRAVTDKPGYRAPCKGSRHVQAQGKVDIDSGFPSSPGISQRRSEKVNSILLR